jgi:hypothetical protein
MCPVPGVASPPGRRPLRTLRCMLGMVSGGLLAVVFTAVAGSALVLLVRLFRISRPGRGGARTGA